MVSIVEASASGNQLNSALEAGIDAINQGQVITFTKYVRVILPLDGFVFWVRADILSPGALMNASLYNVPEYGEPPVTITPAPTQSIGGYLHWTTDSVQEETEVFDRSNVVFTAKEDIDNFSETGQNVLYLGEFEGIRFAFSRRSGFNRQADIYHYSGEAVNPALSTQIIDDPQQLDTRNVIVSNSLPIWLEINKFMPVYPSFLIDPNMVPPYAAVHIDNSTQQALQLTPAKDRNGTQWQLVQEKVTITLYGARNFNALDYVDHVLDLTLSSRPRFGVTNIPIPQDVKRIQNEINAIAMKKVIPFEINYYQTRVRELARKLILKAIPTVIISEL